MNYAKPDRSNFTPNFRKTPENPDLDIGWAEGSLSDGRPYRLECWAADQITNITVFVSRLGLEHLEGKEALEHRVSNAARKVCGSSNFREAGSVGQAADNKSCYENAMAQAMKQLSAPQVASIAH